MLRDTQQAIWQAIYRQEQAVCAPLQANHLCVERQIGIYRNSVFGGLLKALAETYPVSQQLVGTDFFNAMCLRYIAQTPSTHYDINLYGQSLPEFTATFTHAQSVPYLPDVMRLEWAWHRALQTPDGATTALQEILNINDEELNQITFRLHPTATLLHSSYPVLAIWKLHQDDDDGATQVDLSAGAQDLFIWRKGLELRIDVLSPSQAQWLCAVTHEQTLGQMQALADFELNTATLLQRGYISEYRIT